MIIPKKLQSGDEIRVISPATSLSVLSQENIDIAVKTLDNIGLKVTFSKNSKEIDEFSSSSIKSRVSDIHDAFKDKNVKAIICTLGGFNSNQLLPYMDWKLIKENPKILCGFSDITALSNAIFAKTGLASYSGSNFADFGQLKGFGYTLEYFMKCLMSDKPFEVKSTDEWSDDAWYRDQENRKFIKNDGPFVINKGSAQGVLIGGNMSTISLLQGTEFMLSLKNSILFLEEDSMTNENTNVVFDRYLHSLLQQKNADKIKGLVIGRFQRGSQIDREKIIKIVRDAGLKIPVVADADFGHTNPKITFPIGGRAKLVARNNKIKIEILKH